jgi:hypothetical protein
VGQLVDDGLADLLEQLGAVLPSGGVLVKVVDTRRAGVVE